MKFYNWLSTFIIILSSTLNCVEELPSLEIATFEDAEALNTYFEKAQTTLESYETQKLEWQEEQEQLELDGRINEAKEFELKITTSDTAFTDISDALNNIYEVLNTDPTQIDEQTISTINNQIELFNTSIDNTEILLNEIQTKQESLGTSEIIDTDIDTQHSTLEEDTTSNATSEWLDYQKNKLPIILDTVKSEQSKWDETIQEATPKQIAQKIAETFYTEKTTQQEILAHLEQKIPVKTGAEYQTHKEILENIIDEVNNITEFNYIKNRINEIQNFIDNPPPSPKSTLDSQLNLSNKIPADQISALDPSLTEALNNKDISLLQEIAKSLEYYQLTDYTYMYTAVKSNIDIYQKEQDQLIEPEESTSEEKQEQGYLSWMLNGVRDITSTFYEFTEEETPPEETFTQEETTESPSLTEVSTFFLKYTAIEITNGLSRVSSDAVSLAESNLENKKNTAKTLNIAAKASPAILKTYEILPDFITRKIESYTGQKAGEQTAKFIEDQLTQLKDVTSMITYCFAGERAANTVNDAMNEIGGYLKEINADQALIDVTTSLIEFTAEKIKNNPDLIQTITEKGASFFNDTKVDEYIVSVLKKAEQLTSQLSETTTKALFEDLDTAKALIKSEKNRIYKKEPTSLYDKFKQNVSSIVQTVKDAVSNVLKNSETKLTTAKKNYTTARNNYLNFIGIEDPNLATQELISKKLNDLQQKISGGEAKLGKQLTSKTNAYLQSQAKLAQVYTEYQDELNGTLISFETVTTAWDNVTWPTEGQINSDWLTKNKISDQIISLFELRDAKMAHINALSENVIAIKQEASQYTDSDFNQMNQTFINNLSTIVNNELITTINSFDETITNVQAQIDVLQTNLGNNLGIQN